MTEYHILVVTDSTVPMNYEQAGVEYADSKEEAVRQFMESTDSAELQEAHGFTGQGDITDVYAVPGRYFSLFEIDFRDETMKEV